MVKITQNTKCEEDSEHSEEYFWFKIKQEILTVSEWSKHFGWTVKIYCSNSLDRSTELKTRIDMSWLSKGKDIDRKTRTPVNLVVYNAVKTCGRKTNAILRRKGSGSWSLGAFPWESTSWVSYHDMIHALALSTMTGQRRVFRNKKSSRVGLRWGWKSRGWRYDSMFKSTNALAEDPG